MGVQEVLLLVLWAACEPVLLCIQAQTSNKHAPGCLQVKQALALQYRGQQGKLDDVAWCDAQAVQQGGRKILPEERTIAMVFLPRSPKAPGDTLAYFFSDTCSTGMLMVICFYSHALKSLRACFLEQKVRSRLAAIVIQHVSCVTQNVLALLSRLLRAARIETQRSRKRQAAADCAEQMHKSHIR